MDVDIRSDSAAALAAFEKRVLAAIDLGAQEENLRWHSKDIIIEKQLSGDRPAGTPAALLTVLGLVGVEGVTEPLLKDWRGASSSAETAKN